MSEVKTCHLGRLAKRFMRPIRGLSAVTGVVISSVLIAAPAVAESSVHEQAHAPAAVASTGLGSSADAHPADAANVAPTAGGNGVAVIYKIKGQPKYFRVHNALLLKVAKGDVGVKIAHLARWTKKDGMSPTSEVFWVCKQGVPPKTCPKSKHANWVLVTFRRYAGKKCPKDNSGVTYCPHDFIGFRASDMPAGQAHDGAFACWRQGTAPCTRVWPGDNTIYRKAGRLTVVHYVNPNPPPGVPNTDAGSYALNWKQFSFEVAKFGSSTPPKVWVSAQRICHLPPLKTC
ncbi:hypothetical protein [Streptomyces sp. AK02-04a]|uniref:hypothetical protein n=1 Tax=Streptomyces sp. AK02-04a TaxID=3028649 RepID=UPI0029BE480A|nr:hypothetical protein [Streptomyces sp. AK02-04a]MDX3762927.1 hypothetical protein [Streptomyces sp. AK02-04a]